MNVFLTGATGALGSHLIPHLKRKYSLTLLKHRREPIDTEGVKWVCADLCQADALSSLLKNMDCVIHLAAVTHTDDIDRYFECNVIGTRNLVRAAEIHKVKHFIFVSTRAIHPSGGAYAQSKSAAENIVKDSQLNWTIVRPSEVYGGSSKEMLSSLVRLIKKFNFILLPGDGSTKIAPLFIEDIVCFITRIILNNKAYKKIYTLTGPAEYALEEFIDRVAYYLGKQHKVIKINIPLFFLRFLLKVNSKFKILDNLCQDQLSRLIVRKNFDFSAAAKDFDFHPIDIREGLILLNRQPRLYDNIL